MTTLEISGTPPDRGEDAIRVDHVIRGEVVPGGDVRYQSRDLGVAFATPEVVLDELVTPRSEMPPLLDVKTEEIIDFLVACGERMLLKDNVFLQEAAERIAATNPLPHRVIENLFQAARFRLTRDTLWSIIEKSTLEPAALDGWVDRVDAQGQRGSMRAFPPRMINMLAGNSPTGCIAAIAQGALAKGVNLFKMPSSDPFTCVAMLKTMAEVDPDHPVVRSMSAVYWQGGDQRIESTLYRPQYFDKIVAWGGGDAINNVIRYLGPGLELVAFNPKTSISMVGAEAFISDAVIDQVAEAAAVDVSVFNQEACLASRFIFVEGERAGIEKFCARLQERLGVDRQTASAIGLPPPVETRDEIQMLQVMDDRCRVWGKPDGRGLVVLTSDPVDFHPTNKTANVVHVSSLEEAVRFVNVATQTIGIYPPERKKALRDRLASAGAQRVVRLGSAAKHVEGAPHDAMIPFQRFMLWMSDEDA